MAEKIKITLGGTSADAWERYEAATRQRIAELEVEVERLRQAINEALDAGRQGMWEIAIAALDESLNPREKEEK